MCILLLSSQNPDYRLILLSNRDEFFSRPTRPLHWWPKQDLQAESTLSSGSTTTAQSVGPNDRPDELLAGQDVVRGGTWLILSRTGKLAALTNFRDDRAAVSRVSRGALPVAFVSSTSSATFVDALLSDLAQDGDKYGGFSLLCGDLTRMEDGFQVISNRSADEGIINVMGKTASEANDSTRQEAGSNQFECACELSNSTITTPWPKTTSGKQLLRDSIEESRQNDWSQTQLVDRLFDILSTDTLTEKTVGAMKGSIFIPEIPLAGDSYGTRQQTVILLDHSGTVKVFERTIESSTGSKSTVAEEFELR